MEKNSFTLNDAVNVLLRFQLISIVHEDIVFHYNPLIFDELDQLFNSDADTYIEIQYWTIVYMHDDLLVLIKFVNTSVLYDLQRLSAWEQKKSFVNTCLNVLLKYDFVGVVLYQNHLLNPLVGNRDWDITLD